MSEFMHSCFCTIITQEYLPYAKALLVSLREFKADMELIVLVTDSQAIEIADLPSGMKIIFYDELCSSGIGAEILTKYRQQYHDAFRWSMKPVLVSYLLKQYQKVIYTDCDIHFFSSYDFLLHLLNEYDIILSPHFRSSDPVMDTENFFLQYYAGLYNGGFVAASQKGKQAMRWWAEACSFVCKKDSALGQFDDQTHLNLIPIFFDRVNILKHKGCNVANWNQIECKRFLVNNEVVINDGIPIVFIHFTASTIRGILNGSDKLLLPFLAIYDKRLRENGLQKSIMDIRNEAPDSTFFERILKKAIKALMFKWGS